jgi:DeoR family transcriptional regulator, fructose operon transcriptional repressor
MQKSKRLSILVQYLKKHKDVQISELSNVVLASESTIRRDIKDLAKEGIVKELYGSILYIEHNEKDVLLKERISLHKEEKQMIGKKAASLIKDGSFIYLDAGSTTMQMIPYITAKNLTFVTNGLNVATELIKHNHDVRILGGSIKEITLAVVGEEAMEYLKAYHFDYCFIGTNGISENGYSTPDIKEGMLKKLVIKQSRNKYVLSDSSKEGKTTAYVFAKLDQVTLINEK